MKSLLYTHPIFRILNRSLKILPSAKNTSIIWNFGFLLGIVLIFQVLTGLFLVIHYSSSIDLAFSSIRHIMRDVNYGWILRIFHSNGASLYFFFIFFHIGRGIYFNSFNIVITWISGIVILLLSIAEAFLGYVLPWGQISFWGATVITNLFRTIPYLGPNIVIFLWGGFSISGATLSRFFCFHFLVPFLIIRIILIHILFLHETGSSNPLGINRNLIKISFSPFFLTKDILILIIFRIFLLYVRFFNSWLFGDAENFIPANPLITPIHIQPEWYFLFSYAILRAIPNKLGGVVALLFSICILFFLPIFYKRIFKTILFYPINKILFWAIVNSILILTWIGACPVSGNYVIIGQITIILYFSYFIINPSIKFLWDKLLYYLFSIHIT